MGNKAKAQQIINDGVEQVLQASNAQELRDFEWFAHGTAVTLWEMEVFDPKEHAQNYDRIKAAVNQRKEELKHV